jgi:hypothetical protein
MKANELRIGNLVIENGKQKKLHSISNHNAKDYSRVKPIPITEEWLVRFGFEKDEEFDEGGIVDYRYFLHKRNFTLSFTSNFSTEDFIYVNYNQGGVDCFFIHQLQNLYFALTGEELKLNEI